MYHPKPLKQCLNQLLVSIFRFPLAIHKPHIQDELTLIQYLTAF